MSRARLTPADIAERRTMHRAQLRDALMKGHPTAAVREALADLDVQEASLREEAKRNADARADAIAARAQEVATAVYAQIAAIVASLSAPRAP